MRLLFLLVGALVAHAVNNFTARIPSNNGLMFLYTFTEGQLNTATTSTASGSAAGMGPLLLSVPNSNMWSWSTTRQGLTFNRVGPTASGTTKTAVSSSSPLDSAPGWTTFRDGTSYTIELWFHQDRDQIGDPSQVFLSLANYPGYTSGVTAEQPTVCDGANPTHWRLSQQGPATSDRLTFSVFNNFDDSIRCSDLQAQTITQVNYDGTPLTYVVISKPPGASLSHNMYIRSPIGSRNILGLTVGGTWQTPDWASDLLNLAHSFEGQYSWAGSIYMVSMWNRAFTLSDVETNYYAGLPNSVPYRTGVLAVSGLQQVDLTINLEATDFDGDPITFKMGTLPAKGQVLTGCPGACVAVTSGSTIPSTVTFRGAYLGFGDPYTTFTYMANDGFGDSAPVTVAVELDRVNQPPTAFNANATIRSGFYGIVQLNGTDIDDPYLAQGDHTLKPFITSIAAGVAVYDYPAGFIPGVSNPNVLVARTAGPAYTAMGTNRVNDPGMRVVVLLPKVMPAGKSGWDIVGFLEAFQFKIADAQDAESDYSANAGITIRNHLEAVVETFIGLMDHNQTYELRIRDYSSLDGVGRVEENDDAQAIARIIRLPRFGTMSKPGSFVNYTQAQVTAGLRFLGTGYTTPSRENRWFNYKTPSFWAGNDSLVFTGFILGATTWEAPPANVTLLMRPVYYAPELKLLSNPALAVDKEHPVTFSVEIIAHSEPYDDPKKLYWLTIEVFPTFAVSCAVSARIPFNNGDDGASWGSQVGIDGLGDTPKLIALGTLPQLRQLITGVPAGTDLPWISSPAFQNTGLTKNVLAYICEYGEFINLEGACPGMPTPSSDPFPSVLPINAATFTVEYTGGSGNSAGGALPVAPLVFAWIGIGLVAAGCYGCLFWRWWKNRKLQQRTRTNMAAGANASKYLHSL